MSRFPPRGPRSLCAQGGKDVVEMIRNLVKLLRADQEIEVGKAVDEVRAAVLCHAAHDAEDEVGMLSFPGAEVTRLSDRLLLGLITDTAGVKQNHVRGML